jgi:hypothetical protein
MWNGNLRRLRAWQERRDRPIAVIKHGCLIVPTSVGYGSRCVQRVAAGWKKTRFLGRQESTKQHSAVSRVMIRIAEQDSERQPRKKNSEMNFAGRDRRVWRKQAQRLQGSAVFRIAEYPTEA